jgi:AcrR family transcriptional regulator
MDPTEPSPSTKWRRRAEARPGEIVSAALRLFAANGLAATRLEDVAKAAGISKGSIYRYFPTKEDLFRAVVRQELLPTIVQVEATVAGHRGSSAALIRAIANRMMQVMEGDAGSIPKLVLSEAGNFPEIARFYADEVVSRGLRLFQRVLQRGAERGEFRPVEAQHLIPTLVGPILLMLLWRHSVGRHADLQFDHRAVIETHLDIIMRGLAPEPTP